MHYRISEINSEIYKTVQKDSSKIEEDLISLAEASKLSGYHQDYLGSLCRKGKLLGHKIGRNWVVSRVALQELLAQKVESRTSGLTLGSPAVDMGNELEESANLAAVAEGVASQIESRLTHLRSKAAMEKTVDLAATVIPNLEKKLADLETKLQGFSEVGTEEVVGTNLHPLNYGHSLKVQDKFGSNFDLDERVLLSRPSLRVEGSLYSSASWRTPVGMTEEDSKIITSRRRGNLNSYLQIGSFAVVVVALFIFALHPLSFLSNFFGLPSHETISYRTNKTDVAYTTNGSSSSSATSNGTMEQPNYGSVLGLSTSTQGQLPLKLDERYLTKFVQDQLVWAESLGFFRGPKGDAGAPGLPGTSSSGGAGSSSTVYAPITYIQPNPAQNFNGASLFSATELSSTNFFTKNATVSETATIKTLSVTGNSTLAGDLSVTGNITGSLTGSIDPSLTLGSVVFDGASGLTQDNANFFYDDTNNRLGLGTTTPSGVLDIRQGTNGNTLIYAQRATDTSPTGDFITYKNAAGTNLYRVDNSGNVTASGSISGGAQTITSTTTPQLTVQYDGTNQWTTATNSTGTTTFTFSGSAPKAVFIPQTNSTTAFQFQKADATPVLNIDTTNGNVGIGTSSPDSLLHIVSASSSLLNLESSASYAQLQATSYRNSATTHALLNGQAARGTKASPLALQSGDAILSIRAEGYGTAGFLNTNDSSAAINLSADEDFTDDTHKAGKIVFRTVESGGTYMSDRMTIKGSGNVGIGTTTISARLHALATTEQLRLGYDATNYVSNTVSSAGNLTVAPSGGTANITGIATISSILQVGSATATTYSRLGTGTTGHSLDAANDLLVSDDLEVDGDAYFDGTFTVAGATTYNGDLTITKADPSIILDTTTATDTDFWLSVTEDAGGDDDDLFQIGDGTTPGTNPFLTINTSGNVGIGSTAPAAALEVKGFGRFSNSSATAGYAGVELAIDGTLQWQLLNNASTNAFGIWENGTTQRVTVLEGGNVGIGSTSPTKKLEIGGTADVYLNGTAPSIQYRTNVAAQALTNWDGSAFTVQTWDNTAWRTALTIDKSTPDNTLYLKSTGNVGIGTTTPASLLHVQGGLTTTGSVLTLGTNETTVVASDVLGRVNFYAPLDSAGTDANLLAASVVASAEGTFSSSSNATSLLFQTGSSEVATTKMTITSGGNVGIGTTAPAGLLHLNSATVNKEMLILRNTNTTANASVPILIASNSGGSLTNVSIENTGAGDFQLRTGATTEADLGTTRLTVKSGGNVGIGTTTPSELLEVKDGYVATYHASSGNTAGYPIRIYTDTTGSSKNTIGEFGVFQQGASARSGYFALSLANAGAPAEVLRVDKGGNVGIGTTTPTSLLHVQGGLTTTGSVLTLGTNETTVVASDVLGRVNFYAPLDAAGTDANLLAASVVASAEGTFSSTSNATSLLFQTGSSEVATTKMTITSAGNVGIGTTSPGTLLTLSAAAPQLSIASSSNGQATGYWSNNGNTLYLGQNRNVAGTYSQTGLAAAAISLTSLTGDGSIAFSTTDTNNSALTTRLTVLNTGQVAIGPSSGGTGQIEVRSASATREALSAFPFSGAAASQAVISVRDISSGLKVSYMTADGGAYFGGNVGIGTTSPSEKLQIGEPTTANNGGTTKLRLVNGASSIGAQNLFVSGNVDTLNPYFAIETRKNSGTVSEDIRIKEGNVGIGTTAPTSLLHVQGGLTTTGGVLTLATNETTVVASDVLGRVNFYAPLDSAGTDANLVAGSIVAAAEGTFSSSSNATSLLFQTGASEVATTKMVITSAGNVGIGTTAPGAKLAVSNADVSGVDVVSLSPASGARLLLGTTTTNNAYAEFGAYSGINNLDTKARDLKIFSTAATSAFFLQASSGNVGIGTTAPTSLLHVQGGLTTTGSVLTLGTSETTVVASDVLGRVNFYAPLDSAGTDANLLAASVVAQAEGTFSTTSNATSLLFQTGSSEVATTKMAITSGGNVGIGTTVPTTKLDVWGTQNAGLNTVLSINGGIGATTSGPALQFVSGYNTRDSIAGQIGSVYSGYGTDYAQSLVFYTNTGTSASDLSEKMRVTSAGNVGIGTTTPDSLLDIESTAPTFRMTDSTASAKGLLVKTDANKTYLQELAGADGSLLVLDLANNRVGIGEAPAQTFSVNGSMMAQGYRDQTQMLMLTPGGNGDTRISGTIGAYFTVGSTEVARINSNGNLGIGSTTPGSKLDIGSADLGDGVAGPVITVGRNTNATNTGAGSINFQSKAGTAGYVWQDNAGNIRVHTAAPTNANDTAGVVVGDQTSTRETKTEIQDYTDIYAALNMVTSAPLHTFKYTKDVNGYGATSPLAKTRIGFIADEVPGSFMWGNSIDQVSVNGLLMASVKALDEKTTQLSVILANAGIQSEQGSGFRLGGRNDTGELPVISYNENSNYVIITKQLYLSGDSVGQAKILAGATSVRINFSKPYEQQPIVTISSLDRFVPAFVKDVDATGFTIEIDLAYNLQLTTDNLFSWHAFASPEAKLTVSDGSSEQITLVVPVSNNGSEGGNGNKGGAGQDESNGDNGNQGTNVDNGVSDQLVSTPPAAESSPEPTPEPTPTITGEVAGESTSPEDEPDAPVVP